MRYTEYCLSTLLIVKPQSATYGTYWRVGNRSTIKVWGDNWISREGSFKASPISTPLMTPCAWPILLSGMWGHGMKKQLIRNLIQPGDVADILRIHLIDINTPDCLVWYHVKSWLLSFKSGLSLDIAWEVS